MMKSKILIVDDHPLVREGFSQLINNDDKLEVVDTTDNIEDALLIIKERLPDLVLLDISLKNVSGFELLQKIKEEKINIKILIISMHNESFYAQRALQLGANGYINKNKPMEDIFNAIYQVLNNNCYVDETMFKNMVNKGELFSVSNIASQLTNRELEVFRLLGQGHKPSKIAEMLYLSTKTIDTHCTNIKTKLKTQSSNELIKLAVLWMSEQNK